MHVVDRFSNSVMEEPDVRVPLTDGTTLSARIWRPAGSDTEPVPAILEYLPYRKRDGTAARDAMNHPYFAGHGYAVLRVDMRGSGDSDGLMEDEYTPQELTDCVELLRWIAEQPWCTGAIGMIGISWGGFNGLQVAYLAPPELKAVVSIAATVDRYTDDIHYQGGCLLCGNAAWAAQMLSYMSRPPDPALVGDAWRAIWLERLRAMPYLLEPWLEHQQRDAYWRHGSVREDYGRIRAAVLAVGGTADRYMNFVPALVENLDAPVKGIVGPWVHLYPNMAVPEPRIGFLQECLRWWDHWLKGVETTVLDEPDLRVFRTEYDPPATDTKHRSGGWIGGDGLSVMPVLYLGRAPFAGPPVDDRGMVSHGAGGVVGLRGGACFAWHGPDQPGDQREEDAHSLCFDMPAEEGPPFLFGRPVLELVVAVDRPQVQVAVRLNEVTPSGESLRVTYGVLNLSQRNGVDEPPEPMPVGEKVRVRVEMNFACHKFTPGNRIRVAISNTYWPMIWPDPEPATLTIDPALSGLTLPYIMAGEETVPTWERPEIAPPLRDRQIRPMNRRRVIEQEEPSGRATVVVDYDGGKSEDPEHGLITGSHQRERYEILPGDVTSARMETHWTQELERGDWRVRTETRTTLRSDRDAFYLAAEVEAFEGDAKVFERRYEKRIPRRFV
jgi:predicted acyl esterase